MEENGEAPLLQKPQKTRGESMLEEETPCDQLPSIRVFIKYDY